MLTSWSPNWGSRGKHCKGLSTTGIGIVSTPHELAEYHLFLRKRCWKIPGGRGRRLYSCRDGLTF